MKVLETKRKQFQWSGGCKACYGLLVLIFKIKRESATKQSLRCKDLETLASALPFHLVVCLAFGASCHGVPHRSLHCHLLPTQAQHVLAPWSSFLWTPVLCVLPAEFTLLFPEPYSTFLPFLFLLQDSQVPMLDVKRAIIPLRWYVSGPGGWPSISALLGLSTPTSRLLILCKEQVCVGMASVLLNGRMSIGCMSWHALNFFLPTVSLLLCLAAATSAKGLMACLLWALRAINTPERAWSLPWDELPG